MTKRFWGAWVLVWGGCLPAESPALGRQIQTGRDLVRPVLLENGDDPQLAFDKSGVPDLEKGAPLRAAWDLWTVPLHGGTARRMLTDRVVAWPVGAMSNGQAVAARKAQNFGWDPSGQGRIDIGEMIWFEAATGQVLDKIPGVSNYAAFGTRYLYELFAIGTPFGNLTVVEPGMMSRGIGQVFSARFQNDGWLYIYRATDRGVLRIFPGESPEIIRSAVAVQRSSDDGLALALQGGERNALTTTVHDLSNSMVKVMPVPATCAPAGISPSPRRYACVVPAVPAADGKESTPARLHLVDIATLRLDTWVLESTEGTVFWAAWQPFGTRVAVVSERGEAHVLDREGPLPVRRLTGFVSRMQYTADGAALLFVRADDQDAAINRPGDPEEPAAGELALGPAMVIVGSEIEREFLPGRVLAMHNVAQTGLVVARVAAAGTERFGGALATDLLLMNPAQNQVQPVAHRAGRIVLGGNRLLGLVHRIDQGAVSDLVMIDLGVPAREQIIERGVIDFAIKGTAWNAGPGTAATTYLRPAQDLAAGQTVLVVVRERAPSRRDGLWVTTLP